MLSKNLLFESAKKYIDNGLVPIIIYPVGCSYINKEGHKVTQDKSPVGKNYGTITVETAMDEFTTRYNQFKQYHKNIEPWIGILTGKNSGITVVDVDIKDDGMKTWKELKNMFGGLTACVQRSRSGGKHLLFKYSEKFVTASKYGGVGIDIRNDKNGCIVVEPSGNKEGKYRWITSPLEYSITEMPDWLEKWIDEHPSGNSKEKRKRDTPNIHIQEDTLLGLFKNLKLDRFSDYNTWLRLAFLCKRLKRKDIFYHLSESSGKFDGYGKCDVVYNCAKDDCSNTITMGTFWMWLKEDVSDEKYHQLRSSYAFNLMDASLAEESHNFDVMKIIDIASYIDGHNKDQIAKFFSWMVQYMNKFLYFISGEAGKPFVIEEFYQEETFERETYTVLKRIMKNRMDFVSSYPNVSFSIYGYCDKKGEPIVINPVEMWVHSRENNTRKRMSFDPSGNKNPLVYELFDGLDYNEENLKDVEPLKKNHEFFIHLKKRVCKNDKKLYNWLIKWMASIIQKPHQKTMVCPVMLGKQGCGKGIIVSKLSQILGRRYFSHPTDTDTLTKWTAPMEAKLLVFLDELNWGGNKQAENKLKKFITEDRMDITEKCLVGRTIQNYCNFIIASNEKWVINAGECSRRFVVFDVSDELSFSNEPTEEQQQILDELWNTPVDRLAKFLLNVDVSDYCAWKERPMTSALQEQKLRSLSMLNAWWNAILNDGIIDGIEIKNGNHVIKEDMFRRYKEENNDKYKSAVVFWKEMRKLAGLKIGEKRLGDGIKLRVVLLEDLETYRERFRTEMKEPNWEFDDLEI